MAEITLNSNASIAVQHLNGSVGETPISANPVINGNVTVTM
jgi:hypothetical protein